jgi:hypothetical protein
MAIFRRGWLPGVLWVFPALVSSSAVARGMTLAVGPGKAFATPCAALAAAQDGDRVEIDAAGTYTGDVCAITANTLTITGMGGRAHIDAGGKNAQGKGIWVIQGHDTVVENIEFSGASVPDQNGAGIRQEGSNLTLRNCFFHDNENGILSGADASSEILIESTEFARNGFGDGYSHNLYIGTIKKFTLRASYSHSAKIGHLVKSRALENHILYNRLTGEADGTESYEINLPDAGTSYVIGNLIQQGPTTDNAAMLDFASESAKNGGQGLYVVNNTFVNERGGNSVFVSVGSAFSSAAVVKNNAFVGPGTAVNQASAIQAGNVLTLDAGLVDVAHFDYHLLPGSACQNQGVPAGNAADGSSLVADFDYVHPLGVEPRLSDGAIDSGAFEFMSGVASGGKTGSSAGGAPSPKGGSLATAEGGSLATAEGGSLATAGGGASAAGSSEASGCGCRLARGENSSVLVWAWLLALPRLRKHRPPGKRAGRQRNRS